MANLSAQQLFAQAVADHQAGHPETAEIAYRALLHRFPEHLDVAHNLGRLLVASGRTDEAAALWGQMMVSRPSDPRPFLERAVIHLSLGQPSLAEADLHGASRLAQNDITWRRIASVYTNLRRYDLAVDAFERALQFGPAEATNYSGFASLCNELGDYVLAADIARAAIQLSPDSGIGWLELGNALMHQGSHLAAAEAFQQLALIRPTSPDAYCNLGLICQEAMDLDEAISNFDTAISLDPGHETARWNRSLALLARGDLAAAWPDYELRRSTAVQKMPTLPPYPEWLGEPLAGKTVLLLHEQGLGDSLQFIRYARVLRDGGARVWVYVPAPLVRIFQRADGVDSVFSDQSPYPEGADCYALLLSLPLHFGTTIETVPNRVPYLFPDAEEIDEWRRRLDSLSNFKVGLVWAGGDRPHHAASVRLNERRNLALSALGPILDIPDISFVSLQKGGAEAEIAAGNFCHRIADYTPQLGDLAATAALVANLDLVIGVDTAVIHLAGALGKPVWLLNRFDTDWRWLATGEDSPWYPSLRQFRQPVPGDWATPIEQLANALEKERQKIVD